MNCKFCDSCMMSQGKDHIENEYIETIVCLNKDCESVYSIYSDNNFNYKRDSWWENPDRIK
jgi:hypothetical protein